ncbi:helix-turn-helix transcriptional regulator [Amycolatopsis sp. NPDC051102]|uniref:helix-turn-helix domain-containing protein n=1 Tax=Amycolatopsis sp. NPDC051102 TaxID=3155163 RepID=UPI003438BC9B
MTASPRPPALLAASIGLREARMSRRISLRKLATKLGFHPQNLSQWETGGRAPTETDAAWMLGFLRVSREEYQRIMELVRHCNDSNFVEPVDPAAEPLLWTYERRSRILQWAPRILPDLLQTSTYTRATLSGESDIDIEVFQRRVRQDVLSGEHDNQHLFLLGEAALVGGPASPPAPQDQLHHLRSLASRNTVAIRIVPADAGPCGLIDPFSVFEDEERRPTVALRHHHSNLYITSPPLAGRYRETIDQLRGVALDAPASLEFLHRLGNG